MARVEGSWEVKAYDLIFGLGAGCSVSQSLRDAGLQFASYPLDWIAAPGIMQGVEAIERGFEGWFEREDLTGSSMRRRRSTCAARSGS